MNLRSSLSLALAALLIAPATQAAGLFGSNLIANGDAEANTGSTSGNVIGPISGFVTTGNFTIATYGASGGFPLAGDPGPLNRGLNFFAGGPSNPESTATQVINLSAGAGAIDLGEVKFNLSAYLGGYASQSDHAVLSVSFEDASHHSLSQTVLGGVSAADRGNATGLLFRETFGGVPVGARYATVVLDMKRLEGSYNDGYADNLSLTLTTAVPEPSEWMLMAGGLGLLGLVRRRKG